MRPRSAVVIAAATAVLALTGCGGSGAGVPAAPAAKDDGKGPLTAVIVDVSSSTAPLRVPGGPWEQAWLDAATGTATKQGVLWSTTADGDTVSHSLWAIQGRAFKATIPDNKLLAQAELKTQAGRLRSHDQALMARQGRGGSDLLGALNLAARLFRDYPNRARNLVLLTDGGITVDGLNLVAHSPATPAARARLLARLKADGRLPDLAGGVGPRPRVWIGGLGHDSGGHLTPERSRNLIAFWEAMIPAANAELVSDDSASLRLKDFP